MPQQMVDVIYLPFVTGLVGYLTNKIAIKMLFRPYKAKWYTLGWQGIVPKTRPALAEKIAKVVGEKLIAPDDILTTLSGNDVRVFLQNSISHRLLNITEKDIERLISAINIKDFTEKHSNIINKAGSEILETFLFNPTPKFINSEKIAEVVLPEISGFINNIVYSGKTIKEIIPSPILNKRQEITSYIADSAVGIIKTAGRSVAIKDVAAEKVIKFKNSFFGSKIPDMFRMGLLNMFMSDETISNTVKRELPAILDEIAENPSVKSSIALGVNEEIEKILQLKLSDIVDNAPEDFLPSINVAISQAVTSAYGQEKINAAMINFIKEIEISRIIISFADSALSPDFLQQAAFYIRSKSHEFSNIAADKVTELIKSNLASVLEKINIKRTVEDKINTLPLAEVEDILFSFMRTHFKWINILGFAIGFVIGCLQLIATKLV